MPTTMRKRDAAFTLAENIVHTDYGRLSPLDIDVTKRCILDTLGTLLAGSPEQPCETLVNYFKEEGGKGESTIMVYGGKVPATNAALVNATMARCLDLDDCHDERVAHPSVNVVPAALAVAERRGNVSGKDLIASVALGQDFMLRLLGACKVNPSGQGRCASHIFGTFGAVAAVGKLLRLNVDKMVDAIGIANCQASGDMQCFQDGALSQRVHQGFAVRAGVLAALLAERGVTGPKNSLEGKSGYYFAHEKGKYMPEVLTEELGKKFWGTTVSVKPHPCCKHIQTSIEATLGAVIENDIHPEEVVEITVRCDKDSVGLSIPFDVKCDPKGDVEPHFSLPWAVATAVVRRKVWIDDLSQEGVRKGREIIQPLARRVRVVHEPEFDGSTVAVGPAIVEIKTVDGNVYSKRVDYAKGSPQNPMNWEEMAQRFRDCARFSARPIPAANIEQAIERVQCLEEVGDVAEIVGLLA